MSALACVKKLSSELNFYNDQNKEELQSINYPFYATYLATTRDGNFNIVTKF